MPENNNNNDSSGMISESNSVPFCAGMCSPQCIEWERKIDKKLRPVFAFKKCLIFTAVLAVVSLSTALWLRIARLDSQRFVLGINDQRLSATGQGDFSAMFCSKYDLHQIDSSSSVEESHLLQQNFNQGLMRAYMLLKTPTRSPLRHMYSRKYQFELSSSSDYMYWAYQLGNQDLLNIDVLCPFAAWSTLTMFVIQEKNFFQWMQDSQRGLYCPSCIYQKYHLACSSSATDVHISYNSEYSEYIFFFQGLTLPPHSSFKASINFTLFRKNLVFDDDDVVSSCSNVTDCRLSVPYAAHTILLQMETDSPSSSVTLTTRCHPKVEMYIAFFLVVPLALLLLLAALTWSIRKCQDDVLRDTQNADNARSMARLSTAPPPAYTHPTQASAPSRTQSVFTLFARGTPRPQQLPLIDYDVTSDDSEPGVSRSPPAYGTIHSVSIPRLDPRREAMLEVYASTPPPDYTIALSDNSQDETVA